jgi:hypothetical protein
VAWEVEAAQKVARGPPVEAEGPLAGIAAPEAPS